MIETGRSNGIEVRDAHTTEFYRTSNFANMSGKLDELKGRYPDLKLVIVILPDNPTGVYGAYFLNFALSILFDFRLKLKRKFFLLLLLLLLYAQVFLNLCRDSVIAS